MAEPDRIAKAKDKFFAGMPDPTTGQAARRLIKVAEENSGYVYWGARGLSIRSYRSNFADWQNRVTVAWIFPPGWQWMRCKDFSFGAGPGEKGYFEGVPAYLREFRGLSLSPGCPTLTTPPAKAQSPTPSPMPLRCNTSTNWRNG